MLSILLAKNPFSHLYLAMKTFFLTFVPYINNDELNKV